MTYNENKCEFCGRNDLGNGPLYTSRVCECNKHYLICVECDKKYHKDIYIENLEKYDEQFIKNHVVAFCKICYRDNKIDKIFER